ncbi:MAG TPA: histidine kinase [Gemmatimonadaceae bacterium]|nr:histidine kinase [Gemmatimonadaceae bacterium]
MPPAPADGSAPDSAHALLVVQRDRAERLLNAIRLAILLLLGVAALAYAPTLTPGLNRANVLVLVPTLLWTVAQYPLFYGRGLLPGWLAVANAVVDIGAVTAIIAMYALAQHSSLALGSPIFLAYFVILGARPIASSAKRAALVAALSVAAYSLLLLALGLTGRVEMVVSPVAAHAAGAIALLDEGAKLLLLGVAGCVAMYASWTHERFVSGYLAAAREGERLEARLTEAQLQSLKLQLHPHFLFNTLNTITALVHVDPPAAERMVAGLSELLRLSLRTAGEQEVPLSREMEMLDHYLQIQQVRFGDRLAVSIVVDPDAREALVPHFILQPLVENAIRHGIAPRATRGLVEIRATVLGTMLKLQVRDDGIGVPFGRPVADGVGLANTRSRLRSLYGTRHSFHAAGEVAGGFVVDIEIPHHVQPLHFRPSPALAVAGSR